MAAWRVYQVGGGVRDALLGLPRRDRDWVVVGATPEQLTALGYRPVGREFPVFLHPESGEEYALARTERKSGHGYRGFIVFSSPTVTLEEDLSRRDLTINAMARDAEGRIIDPYGGQRDLERRLLRHVSPAFAEDPLRVLRVARFHAQLARLGFSVAPETLALMGELADSGELATLTPERVWQETLKALESPRPDLFFTTLEACGALSALFPELAALRGQSQPPAHHPEGDAWCHTLLSLARAVELSPDPLVRFGALVHDLGKGTTPAEALPHHYGHEEGGESLVTAFCQRLRLPKAYWRLGRLVARHHSRCHRAFELRPGTVVTLLEACGAFQKGDTFFRFLLVCRADARARGERGDWDYPQAEYLQRCREACLGVDTRVLAAAGFQGARFGQALHQRRVGRVRQVRQAWPALPEALESPLRGADEPPSAAGP